MSRRRSNGQSPLVNQQRQITAFFAKATSSPSPISSKSKLTLNPNPSPDPSPSPTTPSPLQSKPSSKTNTKPKKSSLGQEAVGKRIKVYWPLDKNWYQGYVKLFNKNSCKHLVQYDDAEEELLDLENEKIEWVQETVKSFKRLRRGPLSTSNNEDVVIEDEEDKEDSNNVADDDSSDEDWGKSGDKDLVAEIAEEEEELVELEDEEDDGVPTSTNKRKRGFSAKRKLSDAGSLGSAKKTKCGGDVGTNGLKGDSMEPTPIAKSTKAANGMNTLLSGDASARFSSREAEKLRFLGDLLYGYRVH